MMAMIESGESLLRYYLALEGASREMLEAARAGDWDSVCRLEGACAVVISRLRKLKLTCRLDPAEEPERMRILRNIVANDAEIRRLCEPLPEFLDPRYPLQADISIRMH
mgnify:CR=1 FL=1